MRRDSSFCAKSVRYNIFTNGAPYASEIALFSSAWPAAKRRPLPYLCAMT